MQEPPTKGPMALEPKSPGESLSRLRIGVIIPCYKIVRQGTGVLRSASSQFHDKIEHNTAKG